MIIREPVTHYVTTLRCDGCGAIYAETTTMTSAELRNDAKGAEWTMRKGGTTGRLTLDYCPTCSR